MTSPELTADDAEPVTTTAASRPASPDVHPFVAWVLRTRHNPTVRAALRRGDQQALADRAYPHLARFWSGRPYLRAPVLLLAAAAAENTNIIHTDDEQAGLGRACRRLVATSETSWIDSTPGKRLIAVQRQTLPNAHRMLSGLLRALNDRHIALNWSKLWTTYNLWDHPTPELRRAIRRRLLEEFFGDRNELTNP